VDKQYRPHLVALHGDVALSIAFQKIPVSWRTPDMIACNPE